MKTIFKLLTLTIMSTTIQAQVQNFALTRTLIAEQNPSLKVLNSGGTPLENLSKEDARNVLIVSTGFCESRPFRYRRN